MKNIFFESLLEAESKSFRKEWDPDDKTESPTFYGLHKDIPQKKWKLIAQFINRKRTHTEKVDFHDSDYGRIKRTQQWPTCIEYFVNPEDFQRLITVFYSGEGQHVFGGNERHKIILNRVCDNLEESMLVLEDLIHEYGAFELRIAYNKVYIDPYERKTKNFSKTWEAVTTIPGTYCSDDFQGVKNTSFYDKTPVTIEVRIEDGHIIDNSAWLVSKSGEKIDSLSWSDYFDKWEVHMNWRFKDLLDKGFEIVKAPEEICNLINDFCPELLSPDCDDSESIVDWAINGIENSKDPYYEDRERDLEKIQKYGVEFFSNKCVSKYFR